MATQPRDDVSHRHDSLAAVHDAASFRRDREVERLHAAVVGRIRRRRARGAPLRVAFVVSERSKWNGDGLVAAMLGAGWEVTTALYRMERRGERRADAESEYTDERDFFSSLPTGFLDTYDWSDDSERPIESLESDVVFLQQPWRMESFPRRLVGRALPAYLHYGVPLMANHEMHANIVGFHAYLWRRYVATAIHRTLHEADGVGAGRVRVVGYPRFDAYLSEAPSADAVPFWRHPGTPAARVVVAPHHSVGPTSLLMATFPWSHRPLLDLVDAHPDIAWLYKPHPRLRHALIQAGIMTGSEYDAYEGQWLERPNSSVYDGPRYLDVFRTSDALLTDSGSFLAEYLPTGRPVIRMVAAEAVGFNAAGERLRDALYEVRDPASLRTTFDEVVIHGRDPLGERREQVAGMFRPGEGSSADQIVDDLATSLGTTQA